MTWNLHSPGVWIRRSQQTASGGPAWLHGCSNQSQNYSQLILIIFLSVLFALSFLNCLPLVCIVFLLFPKTTSDQGKHDSQPLVDSPGCRDGQKQDPRVGQDRFGAGQEWLSCLGAQLPFLEKCLKAGLLRFFPRKSGRNWAQWQLCGKLSTISFIVCVAGYGRPIRVTTWKLRPGKISTGAIKTILQNLLLGSVWVRIKNGKDLSENEFNMVWGGPGFFRKGSPGHCVFMCLLVHLQSDPPMQHMSKLAYLTRLLFIEEDSFWVIVASLSWLL